VRDLCVLGGALLFILQRYYIGIGEKELWSPLWNKGIIGRIKGKRIQKRFVLNGPIDSKGTNMMGM